MWSLSRAALRLLSPDPALGSRFSTSCSSLESRRLHVRCTGKESTTRSRSFLRLLDQVGKKAEERDVLDRALFGSFWKGVTPGITNAEHGTLEQMHKAFLLIQIG